MTPTARSLDHLRRRGYVAEVVERWIPQANKRRDLFDCADIIAVQPGLPVLLIQSTSDANVSARVNKSLAEARLRTWLKAGGAFTVHGWTGRRLREVPLTLADTAGVAIAHRPPRRKARREERGLFDLCGGRASPPCRHVDKSPDLQAEVAAHRTSPW